MSGERWLGASGALYAVLVFLGDDVLAGEAPGLDATRADVVGWLAQPRDDVVQWAGRLIAVVGVGFLLLFFSRLYTVLRDRVGGTAPTFVLAAGIVGAAAHVAVYAFFGALLLGADRDFDPELVQLAIYIGSALFVLVWLPLALALIVAGTTIVQCRALPRWFGWTAIVQGVVFLAGLGALPVTYAGYVAYPLFWIWLIAASVVLGRRDTSSTGSIAIG